MIENRVFGLHVTNENSCLSADNPHICIGWSALGDLSDYGTREEIELAYDNIYPDKTKNSRGVNIGQIARFKLEVNIGDYVVFRSNRLIHIGVVTSDYYDNKSCFV